MKPSAAQADNRRHTGHPEPPRDNHRPVHYVMWRITSGGAELLVNHYIDAFGDRRPLHAYSLRAIRRRIYDESRIRVTEPSTTGWQGLRAYFRYCRTHRKAIFHLMNTGPLILLVTLLAGVRQPVYHIHGTKYWKKTFDILYKKPAWLLSALFKVTFIANSAYSASIFRNTVRPLMPRVIYNALDVDRFLEKRSRRTTPRRMAYAGRLHTGKNVDLVIRLFEAVAADFPDMELWIAGEGDLRPELEEQARQSPFRERIKFKGFLTDIASFYASVDLFVFLSAYESFGNVLAEALLTGLPVLTSDIPVFREIHGGEPDFLLGVPDQEDLLRQRLRQSLDHYPRLAEKAWRLSSRLGEKFSIETHIRQIELLYADH